MGRRSIQTTIFLVLTAILLQPRAVRAQDDAPPWHTHLIPLPKEMAVEDETTVSRDGISVIMAPGSGPLVGQAVRELTAAIGGAAGDSGTAASLELHLGILDREGASPEFRRPADAARLRSLPNREQAYVIRPEGTKKIILAGLDERGVYHAAQTMKQLLTARAGGDSITVPLTAITDWPDMEYRGFWDDYFPPGQVAWMASHKLNLVDCHAGLEVDGDGHGIVTRIPRKGPAEADGLSYPVFCSRHAVLYVPIITHFSHLKRTGIYERYPELVGEGASPDDRFVPPCAARPEFIAVLADWMSALAARPHIEEISVWLSEVELQCGCDSCRAVGQYVMEARAAVAAFRRVQETRPDLRLRILLTQGSYPSNEKILAELPPDIGVVYYHGEKTYDSGRRPIVDFPLRLFTAKGGRLGICPQLTVSWALVIPWSSARFVHARMGEFVFKGVSFLSAYAPPDLYLHEFNVLAAAEWSWNARGRGEWEFARAWAVRKGFDDPKMVADWAVIHGDMSWNVYGSGVPFEFIEGFGTAREMIENRVRPVLGEDMFRSFPSLAHFERAAAQNDSALVLARAIGDSAIVEETVIARGCLYMARECYHIAELLWEETGDAPVKHDELMGHVGAFETAVTETGDALRRWEALFGEDAGGDRLDNTIRHAEEMVDLIKSMVDTSGR